MERFEYMIWRKKHNIKLQDIAEYIGCTGALICMFERNKANISDEKVSKYNEFIRDYSKKVGGDVGI